MPASEKIRYHEIDLLKGLACVLMMIGHAFRIRMPLPGTPEKVLLYFMDYSGPIFFFVSGMNVMTFLERNRDKPGFAATRFYIASAALLFVLSIAYNINRANLYTMEIFQGVAVCTVAVYLLMRTRLPVWAHWLIIAALYGIYLQFRIRLELNLINPDFQALRSAIPPNAGFADAALKTAIVQVGRGLSPIYRLFFLHFGPLPWIVFFYIGALCYRSLVTEGRPDKTWAIFFSILFLFGPFAGKGLFAHGKTFLDSIYLSDFLELDLRGVPSYILTTTGGAGLLYLLLRRRYRGSEALRVPIVRWFARRMETLGKESLMFLVAHWWVISTIILVHDLVRGKNAVTAVSMHEAALRSLLSFVVLLLLVPWLARVRDHWSGGHHYGLAIGLLMAASLFSALVFVLKGQAPWANYLTFGASFGFAFVYPYLRGKLRARFTKRVGPEAA